jgi:peptidyl-prolyl cis-trans isomerase C
MKYYHALLLLGAAACLGAQTPPPKPAPPTPPPATPRTAAPTPPPAAPQTAAPTPPPAAPQTAAPTAPPAPHVELSIDKPEDRKMPVVPPDRVVLSVGDVKLTAEQFDQLIDSLPDQYKTMVRGAGRKSFGDNLVRMLVLAQEGKRRKLDQAPGYSLQTMFQMANVLASVTFQQISKEIKAEDADLRKYYAEHKTEFDQVSARHILIRMQGSPVPVKPGQKDLTPEEALAKAEDLEKRIKAGEDFAKLATAESDDAGSGAKGGDLGFFRHGQMVPSFDEAAFKLSPGQVSEPVRSQFGYHIIKVEASKTFEDVKADIEKRVVSDLSQKALLELQKNSAVVYDTEFFNMVKQ